MHIDSSNYKIKTDIYLKILQYIKTNIHRRRGRPKNTWSNEVAKKAHEVAHDTDLHEAVKNQMSWQKSVKSFCSVQLC